MATRKDLDFRGERLDDADFSGARLHSSNLEGARITDGWLHNADISGYIGGLLVNGVEVAPLVEAELDRRFPERVKLRAVDPPGLLEAWTMIEGVWARTVARARALPEPLLSERIDDDWSFIETLRHLIFATDAWLFRMVRHVSHPYHPWGLAGSFLADPGSLGLDCDAHPSFDDVLAVRREHMSAVKETMAGLSSEALKQVCIPPETPGHPTESHSVHECLRVILDEEWEHSRYANRDLAILEARPQ
jgi:hypothetical protein